MLNQLSTFCSAKINDRGDDPLLDLIHSLGDWPVIVDSWSSDSYDLEELIANVSGIGYSILWKCAVAADTSNTDNYIIQVSSLLIHPLARLKGKYDSLLDHMGRLEHVSVHSNLNIRATK